MDSKDFGYQEKRLVAVFFYSMVMMIDDVCVGEREGLKKKRKVEEFSS